MGSFWYGYDMNEDTQKQATDGKINRANRVDQLRFFGGWLSPDVHTQLTVRVRLANTKGWKVHQVIERQVLYMSGAPDRIRTCNPQFRRLVPYPVWPRVRCRHYVEDKG